MRLRTLIERWRDAKSIDALSDVDLSDLGFSREQLQRFMQMPPDVPDRVVAMGAIFGLSEGELRRDHAEWAELLETCGTCPDRASCKLVLNKGDLANPRDAAFCPNRRTFSNHWSAA